SPPTLSTTGRPWNGSPMSALANRLAVARRDFGAVLRNRDVLRLELAWAFSIISTWAYSIAVVMFSFEKGGATAVGLVGLLRWLPGRRVSPRSPLRAPPDNRRV